MGVRYIYRVLITPKAVYTLVLEIRGRKKCSDSMFIHGFQEVIQYAYRPAMAPIVNRPFTRTASTPCFGVAPLVRRASGAPIWTAMIAWR